jgi:methionine--tRNA ligase
MPQRKLFVTTALPYANGKFHIGHIMEYIQADIWVRHQRMQGNMVHFVGADDAHGAPIMIAAEKAGKTPQAFVGEIAAGRKQYLDGFHIRFDNWHSTDSPENTVLAQAIYQRLKANGLVTTRTIEQFYDPVKGMFLPDRYIKGECPVCHAKDQYGDACEVCSSVYSPTELIEPYSTLTGARPELRSSDHYFFQLSKPEVVDFLKAWTQDGKLQPEMAKKAGEWFEAGMADWDISRDAPYFGIEIPDAPGKYFYVWLDAPIGYLASLKNHFDKGQAKEHWHAASRTDASFEQFIADPAVEQVHFIGKDIVYFHTLFWPAMLQFSGRKTPHQVNVHGFITVSGEKMSKSRGTGIDPLKYLSLGMNPEWLRYYIAAKLNARVEDVDFNPDDFVARVNSDLVGKYVNIASRAVKFIPGGKLVAGEATLNVGKLVDSVKAAVRDPRVRQGLARSDGFRRRGEPALRRRRAVEAGEGRPGRGGRPGLLRLPAGLQGAHGLPEARAAATGRAGGSLPELRAPGLDQRRAGPGRRPPGRRVQAPDAARGLEAARRAVRAAGRGWRSPAPTLPRRGRERETRWRGDRARDHDRRLRQDRPAHREDRGVQGRRRLDQAAAAHPGRGRRPPPQRVLRDRLGLPARGTGGQAHGDGRQPGAAQDEVRRERGHGAGGQPRGRKAEARIYVLIPWPGAEPGMRVR